MNKLVFLMLLLPLSSFAQINKGNWLLGGLVGGSMSESERISSLTTQETSRRELNVLGQLGYFVAKKLALGLTVQHTYSNENTLLSSSFQGSINQRFDISDNIFAAGPFIRYYLLSPQQKFNLYIQGNLLTGNVRRGSFSYLDPSSPITEERHGLLAYNASVAPVYFINKNISIECVLSYSKFEHIESINTFSTALGLQIHLGK